MRREDEVRGQQDLQGIEDLRRRDEAASKAYDVEALAALWTEDCVVMAPGTPPMRGKESLRRALLASRPTQTEVLEYEEQFEETLLLGDYAVEWGSIRGTERAPEGGAPVRSAYQVMRVLKRDPDGRWRVHRSIFHPADDMDGVS